MRTRHKNHKAHLASSGKWLALLLALALASGAGAHEFIISYTMVVKNKVAVGERYSISSVLAPIIKKSDTPTHSCSLMLPSATKSYSGKRQARYLTKLLRKNKEWVLSCLLHSGASVREDTTSLNNDIRTRTIMKTHAKRVDVYIGTGEGGSTNGGGGNGNSENSARASGNNSPKGALGQLILDVYEP